MGIATNLHRPASRARFLILTSIASILFFYYLLQHSHFPPSHPTQSSRRKVQHPNAALEDVEKAAAIRAAMKRTFWKYKEAAWGMDEVRPISGRNRTTRNGWAATIVDSLTTTALMGLEEEFNLELDFVLNNVDFNEAIDLVDPFETTIRYLGAMVSTVDLLDSGQLSFSVSDRSKRDRLLQQAVNLASKLAPSFDSPTGMIWPRVNFTTDRGCREHPEGRPYPGYPHATIGPARAGTNWLENMSLSRLTGNPVYGKNATGAWRPLVWNKWLEEWPGIIDGPWDIMTGAPYDRQRSWGAGHDSYYEYLIKAHILYPRNVHSHAYRDRWLQAVASMKKHLVFPSVSNAAAPGTSKLWLHSYRQGFLINEQGHLACFAGGNLLLGGTYLSKKWVTRLGLELIETCRHTYAATSTGIGPENVAWFVDGKQGIRVPSTEDHWRQVREKGFWLTGPSYLLRPEYVESLYYAWRITGQQKYRDWAWEAWQAIEKWTEVEWGYAEVRNVDWEGAAIQLERRVERLSAKGEEPAPLAHGSQPSFAHPPSTEQAGAHKHQDAAPKAPSADTPHNDKSAPPDPLPIAAHPPPHSSSFPSSVFEPEPELPKDPRVRNLRDKAESFWAAETLKYLYLTFSNSSVADLDVWVFSTEAHPFKITLT